MNSHIMHCCFMHGCKYGDLDCPVKLGVQAQMHPCEFCPDMLEDAEMQLAYLLNEMYDKGHAAAMKDVEIW